MKSNSLLFRALGREKTERPPVWLMRQAGRYLAEYRELKERYGFLTLCCTPELAAEVTLQPVRLFDLDAAILFSDILIPARALGIEVDFNPGPVISNPVRTDGDVFSLHTSEVRKVAGFVPDAVSLIRSELDKADQQKSLIGFAGAPWTMACYLIDQQSYKHFQGTQIFCARFPHAAEELLGRITAVTIDYLLAQIEAGADVVQIFDSWGGILSIEDYRRWSLPFLQEIFSSLSRSGARTILYVNGSTHLLEALAEVGADCLSIDWRTDLYEVRTLYSGRFAIQGNLDPTKMFLPAEHLEAEIGKMLRAAGAQAGYIANLGHGILPGTPRESVRTLVDAVRGRPR